MLSGPALDAAVVALPTIQFRGSLYRAVHSHVLHNPAYRPDPLYSDSAPRTGARYTPVGGPRSLYFAEEHDAAKAEVNQAFLAVKRIAPSAAKEPPTVFFEVEAELERVLDVTDPAIISALGTSAAELAADWLYFQALGRTAPTQDLGAAVHRTGHAQAIRYYSTAAARLLGIYSACYVIFCDLLPPGFVEVYDPFGPLKRRIP